jgi:hypothetical protein
VHRITVPGSLNLVSMHEKNFERRKFLQQPLQDMLVAAD